MPPPPPKPAPKGSDDASLASVIDTIEAIIIALVIALTFRAFIVEAFVIPTGSMAPTLLGAHYRVICPECGYEFDYNADLRRQAVDINGHVVVPNGDNNHAELVNNQLVPIPGLPIYCPNCRYPISAKQLPQFLRTTNVRLGSTQGAVEDRSFAWANNGDRILVLKYLYAVDDPNRWDVIVFKEPQEAHDNYIKRLIGKPGETIEIIGGDVYISPPGANPMDPAKRLIARKPEAIQPYLWQLVYDNDFYPVDAGKPRPNPFAQGAQPGDARPLPERTSPFENPWESDDPWQKGPVMTYRQPGPSMLHFNLTPPQAAGAPYTLNTLGYNNDFYVSWNSRENPQFAPRSFVGDLRLETLWRPQDDAAAVLSLTLGRPNNCYRVEWSAAGLMLEHYNLASGQFEKVNGATVAALPAPRGGQAYSTDLCNVDHEVRFYIDGKKVIEYKQLWTAAEARDDERMHPNDEQEKPDTMIQVGVGGPCTLGHLKLYRDLYYTQVLPPYPHTGTENNPITLRKGEYFALGDNSRESADGRLWSTVYPALEDLGVGSGIVPERYLLGKAFFVYWPAGFRPAPEAPYPLIPDTGAMRVIR